MQLTRALAATSEPGVWTPAEMPEWAVPAAFGILTIVYALIVFEVVHRALAAAVGGIVAVITLHVIGNGPDLGRYPRKDRSFRMGRGTGICVKRRFHLEIIDYTLYNNSCFLSIFG